MLNKTRFLTALLLTAAPVMAHQACAADITGAGSSFAAPIYQAWGDGAKSATGVSLNYQSVGSSAGQNLVTAHAVDFGASDAPMADSKLTSAALYQFPTVIGGIVPIVNVPGIASNQLKLTGAVLADIYLGKISNWNDPKIAALNPGVSLPDVAIAPVHRADGSGTTFVFTSYLTKMSADWKDPRPAQPHRFSGLAALALAAMTVLVLLCVRPKVALVTSSMPMHAATASRPSSFRTRMASSSLRISAASPQRLLRLTGTMPRTSLSIC